MCRFVCLLLPPQACSRRMSNNPGRVSRTFNLRETGPAREQLDKLADVDSRFTQVWEGVAWLILRDPYLGTPIPGFVACYAVKTVDFLAINYPIITVTYHIPEETIVEIIDIR